MSIPFDKLCEAGNKPLSDNDCNGWYNKLMGKVILEDDEESSLKSDEFVRKKDLPTPNRVVTPNSFITMDFRPERLNVEVDHSMKVTGVRYS